MCGSIVSNSNTVPLDLCLSWCLCIDSRQGGVRYASAFSQEEVGCFWKPERFQKKSCIWITWVHLTQKSPPSSVSPSLSGPWFWRGLQIQPSLKFSYFYSQVPCSVFSSGYSQTVGQGFAIFFFFFCKGQVSILDFVGHTVSAASIQLHRYSAKAAME